MKRSVLVLTALLTLGGLSVSASSFAAAREKIDIELQDITGRYAFLGEEDLLAIIDEDGMLNGYIEVIQEDEEESSEFFSYTLSHGSREGTQVSFKTIKIHGLYYRFTGQVEKGKSRNPNHTDFLRLVGTVEIVRRHPATGKEMTELQDVVLKSLGYEEEEEDDEEEE